MFSNMSFGKYKIPSSPSSKKFLIFFNGAFVGFHIWIPKSFNLWFFQK
jgi:hypothetical protein